uniref:Tudor domain-containing protein n=2 Tax=Strongyloides stercoralis TaxID=6248 RepID=A0A0K0EFR2_STRER
MGINDKLILLIKKMAAKKSKLLTKKQRKAKEKKEKDEESKSTNNLSNNIICYENSIISNTLDNVRLQEALKNACISMQQQLNTNDFVSKIELLHTKRRKLEEDNSVNNEGIQYISKNYFKSNVLNWNKKVLIDSGIINFNEKIDDSLNNYNYIRHCEAKEHEQVVIKNIVSPSCLFVRRKDSPYKNLEIRLPCAIQQLKWKDNVVSSKKNGYIDKESLSIRQCIGCYVLAPYTKDLYVRARIISVSESSTYVKVIYIDHGSTSWVHKRTLAVLDNERFNYRWETRHVGLKNVYPKSLSNDKDVDCWTTDHINALKTIINQYKKFEFRTIFYEKRIYANNFQMVEIYPVKDFLTSTPCNYFPKEIEDSDDEDCVNSIIHSDNYLEIKSSDQIERKPMSINAELVIKYPKLFYRKRYIGKKEIEPLFDIVPEGENKFIPENTLPWFRYFPPLSKSATPTFWTRFSKYKLSEKDIEPNYEMNYKVDHWNYEKLKNYDYIIDNKYIVVYLLKPYFQFNALKLTGIPINKNEVNQLKCQLIKGNGNLKEVYNNYIENKLESHYENIVLLSKKYLKTDNVPQLTIQDIISSWQEGEPCYCTINVSFTLDSGMWYRFEVIGFKPLFNKYQNTFLVKVRYLDINGYEVLDISNLYQLPETSDSDLPLVLNFDYDKIKIKNEEIQSEDEIFISYIKTLLKRIPYNMPIVVELDTENISSNFPNKNKWSSNFYTISDVLKTDIKIKSLHTFQFNKNFEIYNFQTEYKLLEGYKNYEDLFKNVTCQNNDNEDLYYNMDNINDYDQTFIM